MPKINWAGEDNDEALTAEDVEGAEDGWQPYSGEIPPGGVYRFTLATLKFRVASTGIKGLATRLTLDGSWKTAHQKYDGCPLFDNLWMTKGSAAFVKAFAAAIGVSADDIVNRVVTDEDGYVTKIGRKVIKQDTMEVFVAVRRGTYNDEPRLEKAGTGYQLVESSAERQEEPDAPPARSGKTGGKKATKGKARKNDDEEPPF